MGNVMSRFGIVTILALGLLGCSKPPLKNDPTPNSLELEIEDAQVINLGDGSKDVKVSLKTTNNDSSEHCELAGSQEGRAFPPQPYFVFLDRNGREVYDTFVRPQFSGPPMEDSHYKVLRRAPGSTDIGVFFAWGDDIPEKLASSMGIRVKAARFLFPCVDANGEELPEMFEVGSRVEVERRKEIFSHDKDGMSGSADVVMGFPE